MSEVSAPEQEIMDLLATGVAAFMSLSAIEPDKRHDDGRFWTLLEAIGFARAFPSDGAASRCGDHDDDWAALLDAAVAHFAAAADLVPADPAGPAPLHRARAARAVLARETDGEKVARLRELAPSLPDTDRRLVERSTRDLAACDATKVAGK